jgi:hypothetical protein
MNADDTRQVPRTADGATGDPPRDAVLAHHLAQYEAKFGQGVDRQFLTRIGESNAAAMRRQTARGWIVATSRYARTVVPVSVAAAAAAVFLLSRMPANAMGHEREQLLAAAAGATSTTDIASSWVASVTTDRALLKAFGLVTP